MKFTNFYRRTIARKLLLIIAFALGLSVCLYMAWQLRFDFSVPESSSRILWFTILWIVPVKLFLLAFFRQYTGLLTFFGVRDLSLLFAAMAGSSSIIMALWFWVSASTIYLPPRGVILIDFVLSFMGLASIRLAVRLYRERARNSGNPHNTNNYHVGIVGAGHSGANLTEDLFMRRELGLHPKYFFDDDPGKHKSQLHGIPILGKPEILLDTNLKHGLDKLIIALPTGSGRRIKEVVNIANKTGLICETVPSLEEITSGRIRVSKLRKVQIQDLLRREPVRLETENNKKFIKNKVVMVTGAGGSIGSELCRQIAYCNPKRLLLIEQCEVQMFPIERELSELGYDSVFVTIIADILDEDRMESIFQRYKPNLIFHAAAHKHVSLMEQQPVEAFRNNTMGTFMLANMALRHAVEYFLLVSTDKAINPTSVMGATKRMAEILTQSLHASCVTSTRFMTVRFGNVLGSSGSVVPIFEKQIDEGGPVMVTHPEVTRFFMTIPEAAGLILQAASLAKGGEIFVLDMGDPVKIIDLAHQLIELHGHKLGRDIEIEFTGLKPGEKLFEEITHKRENLEKTGHPKILRFVSEPTKLTEIRKQIQEIEDHQYDLEPEQIKQQFKKILPEYNPYLS
ncbi:polysaccharide biosynthesis protein [bacterium]|nr:polysaccharide biosynthesis protein [bacterium]MDC0309000.1 polysaccharide biosynthesis protein [bacterium]